MARDFGLITKSNLILGLGETREEISQALVDLPCSWLRSHHHYAIPCAQLIKHHPVERWVKPEEFVELSSRSRRNWFPWRNERSASALKLSRWASYTSKRWQLRQRSHG